MTNDLTLFQEHLMFCDECDRGYHTYCVQLQSIPKGGPQMVPCSFSSLAFHLVLSFEIDALVSMAVCSPRQAAGCASRAGSAPLAAPPRRATTVRAGAMR
jgi:hypothetical protein